MKCDLLIIVRLGEGGVKTSNFFTNFDVKQQLCVWNRPRIRFQEDLILWKWNKKRSRPSIWKNETFQPLMTVLGRSVRKISSVSPCEKFLFGSYWNINHMPFFLQQWLLVFRCWPLWLKCFLGMFSKWLATSPVFWSLESRSKNFHRSLVLTTCKLGNEEKKEKLNTLYGPMSPVTPAL